MSVLADGMKDVHVESRASYQNADARVTVMYSAAHPVLHRGGEAALVALAISGRPSSGTIKIFDTPPPSSAEGQTAVRLNPLAFSDGFFATEALRNYLRLDVFLHAVYHKIRGTKRARLDFDVLEKGMGLVQESCCCFAPYGRGDGAKIICAEPLDNPSVSYTHLTLPTTPYV